VRSNVLAACLLGLVLLALPSAAGAATPAPPLCTRHVDDAATGPALSPAITLSPSPDSAQRIVNLGTNRGMKTVQRLTFTTDRALPASLTADQLTLDALISRAGTSLESTDFPDPTFSNPRISEDRQSITFTACLSPGSIPPGKYVGSVTLSGPPGLSAASTSLTINAKVASLFWLGSALSLVVAFMLIVLKDAAAYRKKTTSADWFHAFLEPVQDPLWWATTLITIAVAFGTLYGVYSSNPAWGSGGFADIAALISAGFAAVGGHTIITTLTPSSS
jgi:hypothetical protein